MFEGEWIQTASAAQFFLVRAEGPIRFDDIARSLSQICRFTGHTRTFYSVAQHAVEVSHLVTPANAAWGLLHDAAEAYIGDISRPWKKCLRVLDDGMLVPVEQVENRILARVAENFGLNWPMPAEVKQADTLMLLSERAQLLDGPIVPWTEYASLRPDQVRRIIPWSADYAQDRFIGRARELGIID